MRMTFSMAMGFVALAFCTFSQAEEKSSTVGKIASSAEDCTPMNVGEKLPELTLKNAEGDEKTLHKTLAGKPGILVFYRGNWCPYCMVHLQGLQEVLDEVTAMGYQLLAISPNTPEKLAETDEKLKVGYTLLSDSKMDAAKALGIAFQVDDETVEKYKGYGIDLLESSGESHNALPIPAIFIVDAEGIIRFVHANADYKTRLDNKTLLEEAKAALK